ncbi:HtaA domain-containing protein [Corynebacterium suicordis]
MSFAFSTRRHIAAVTTAATVTLGMGLLPVAMESTGAVADAQSCLLGQKTVQAGSLGWRVSEKWMEYMAKPFVIGKISGSAWNGNQFVFAPKAEGTTGMGGQGTVKFAGDMHFNGHAGALDMNLTDVTMKINGNKAQIFVDYVTTDPENRVAGLLGQKVSREDVPIVDVTLNKAADFNSDSVDLAGKTILTPEGAKLFGSYEAGMEFAPTAGTLSMGVGCKTGVLPTTPIAAANVPAAGNAAAAPAPANTGNGGGQASHSVSGQSQSQAQAQTQAPAQVPAQGAGGDDAAVCSGTGAVGVTSSKAQWGVRESFRNYLTSSTAKGSWQTGGVGENNGIFQFSGNSGAVNPSQKSGSVLYPGTIHFTGHGGTLDIKFSNMEIQFNGNSGQLLVNARSNTTEGQARDFGRIALANLSFSSLETSATSASGTATPTLTAVGSEAFGSFYSAGEALDQLNFSAQLGGSANCAAGQGGAANAAATGTGSAADAEALLNEESGASVMDEVETDTTNNPQAAEGGDQFSIKPTGADSQGNFNDSRVASYILLAALFVVGGVALSSFTRRNPTAS